MGEVEKLHPNHFQGKTKKIHIYTYTYLYIYIYFSPLPWKWLGCSFSTSLYLLTGLSFRITGSSLSRMLRMELTGLGTSGMDRHAYNVVVTGHGIIMIFFFVMPMLI